MYKINTQMSIDRPTITDTIPVIDWLNKIKEGHLLDKIRKARSIEDHSEYQKFKAENIPCVNYNAIFSKYKVDKNVTSYTGLLYLDFDDPRFDISFLDTNKIFSYYKSLSGQAYGVLVKVDGLTKANLKATAYSICTDLGVIEYLDTRCLKIGQSSVLSYDPDLFLNLESPTFKAVNLTPSPLTNKIKKGYSKGKGGKIRFNNLSDYEEEGKDYVVDFDKGFEFVRCYIPFKTPKGKRNDVLLSYCNNLVWLNPFISKSECFNILVAVNVRAFDVPVEEERLHKVMDSIFRYLEDGTLKPLISKRNRKVCFSSKVVIPRFTKLAICGAEWNSYRTNKVKESLKGIISNWDVNTQGKVTIAKIQQLKIIGRHSVDKYYKEFKDLVVKINNF